MAHQRVAEVTGQTDGLLVSALSPLTGGDAGTVILQRRSACASAGIHFYPTVKLHNVTDTYLFAEVVFDLSMLAAVQIERLPAGLQDDSRLLSQEIINWAFEFYEHESPAIRADQSRDYMDEIETFFARKLSEL